MQPAVISRPLPNRGATYGPATQGPFPGVLLLHGSEGGWSGWSHRTAALLAANGYLCYPHSYSKSGNFWNAGHIEGIEIAETAQALADLRTFASCTGKVAVYGVSRGAEHALLLSSLMAKDGMDGQPDAIACHAAPDVVCGAFDARSYRDSGDPGWQAWDPSRRAWLWNGASDALLPSEPIEVDRFAGPMFLSVGMQDEVWSPAMTKRLHERRKAAGLPVEAYYYRGEGHVPYGVGENHHHDVLLSFLERTIGAT